MIARQQRQRVFAFASSLANLSPLSSHASHARHVDGISRCTARCQYGAMPASQHIEVTGWVTHLSVWPKNHIHHSVRVRWMAAALPPRGNENSPQTCQPLRVPWAGNHPWRWW